MAQRKLQSGYFKTGSLFFYVLLLPLFFQFLSCGHAPQPADEKPLFTTVKTKDTSLLFTSAGKSYSISFTQTAPNAFLKVTIMDEINKRPIYTTDFNHTALDSFQQINDDKFLISIRTLPSGSGFFGTYYLLNMTQINITPLCEYEELTRALVSKNKPEILILQGIWRNDTANNESHFAPHRQRVSLYTISGNKISMSEMGITTKNYDPFDQPEGLIELYKELNIPAADF